MSLHESRTALCVVAILWAMSPEAYGAMQDGAPATKLQPATIGDSARDGDDILAVTLPPGITSNLIAVRIDTTDTATQQLVPTMNGGAFAVHLTATLRAGQTVDVKYFANGQWSEWSDAVSVQ